MTSERAVFDPKGETIRLIRAMGIEVQPVEAGADLAGYEMLVVGKGALTTDGPSPAVSRVRDQMRSVHANLLGFVLNAAQTSNTGYFKEHYRSFYKYAGQSARSRTP